MKIALCDDNLNDFAFHSTLLNKYCAKYPFISYDTYANPLELLDQIKETAYDVLLLDVILPGINGIELAQEIRQYDETIKIVFISTSAEYAVESYTVDAFYYVVKPITEKTFAQILDKLVVALGKTDDLFYIKTPKCIFSFPFQQIEYVEVTRKKLTFYLTDKTHYSISAPLSEYEPSLLAQDSFIKVHRSFIVNMQQMHSLKVGEFTTKSGRVVPVSKRQYKTVKEQFTNYLFSSKS